ncbi:MAG: hypothetical protein GY906_39775 [bacterium]|nr:hypothetical protein [bacterium]
MSKGLQCVLVLPLVVVSVSGGPFAQAQNCDVNVAESWKNTINFPDDSFRVQGDTTANPDWIKFTILLCDPTTVYFQDSNRYRFHYGFATDHLEPFLGMTHEEFDQVTLYEAGQLAVIGAVLMPASGIWPPPAQNPEYAIQIVRHDPYDPQQVVDLFNTVKAAIQADVGVQAFYFPTFEQSESAEANREFLDTQGATVSSVARWADGNACYSDGWALGELKYFPGSFIEDAYLNGDLLPSDILLTDSVPSEIPFVAGILTLSPETPNSHVAILANSYGIPFVHLALEEDSQQAWDLVGNQIVLRAYADWGGCDLRLIDVEGLLSTTTIAEILALKDLPPLDISSMQPFGAYSTNVDGLVLSDIQYFGGKATNFGFLRRVIPDKSPVAGAFSFDLWNAFLDQTLTTGGSLRDHIDGVLSGYTFPPANMDQLADDLDAIRDIFKDDEETSFSQELQDTIIATLQDPQYGFDLQLKVRFRSSTNVEDSAQFTGAGLYDSKSGCLPDDLDDDDVGPSLCDPNKSDERGVFRAIRRVFASFYNDNAFLERLRWGVDESEVGMAVLFHHNFPDEIEMANGVATLDHTSSSSQVFLVSQLGAVSVTNPEGGAIPEEIEVNSYQSGTYGYIHRYSSLVRLGDTIMTYEDDYFELAWLMRDVAEDYARVTGRTAFLLDYEYKKMEPGGGAMPTGGVVIKQVREVPRPDTTPSITPFIVNEPVEFCTYQGEYGDVFANHRLKSRLSLATRSFWMTLDSLQESFFTDATLNYTDTCWTRSHEGFLPEFPEAWHAFNEDEAATTDGWAFAILSNVREYALNTGDLPLLVSEADSPILTLEDFGWLDVSVDYESAVPTWDWPSPTTTTSESVRLFPCPKDDPDDILQERTFTNGHGLEIETSFYWPPPPGASAGYTAPLIRWVETTIKGLTSEDIVLHGWYSQTYRPAHHNFNEHFIFEPRLEPGISQTILDELTEKEVQFIHLLIGAMDPIIALYNDEICDQELCESNDDCGYPRFGHFCRRQEGDCTGFGTCEAIPDGCFASWDPVCGGYTFPDSDKCYGHVGRRLKRLPRSVPLTQ